MFSVCAGDGGTAGQCCGAACLQTSYQTDPMNCGTCGTQCPAGESCSNGNCRPQDGGFGSVCPATCNPGYSCRNGDCIRDACGSTASVGEKCNASAYAACCGGPDCVDLYTSKTHCGQCGKTCSANQFCNAGTCVATPTCNPSNNGSSCPIGPGVIGKCCGSQCLDTTANANHCGSCNSTCGVGTVCTASSCVNTDGGYPNCTAPYGSCPAGLICNGTRCLAPTCAPGTTGGQCAFGIGIGTASSSLGTCCNGKCTDVTQDGLNCGTCGTACAAGSLCLSRGFGGSACTPNAPSTCAFCQPGQFCVNNQCQAASCGNGPSGMLCLTSNLKVGMCCSTGFSSTCADAFSDSSNCGGCGVVCPSGSCVLGVCQTGGPTCNRGDLGRFCDVDAGISNVCCQGAGCVNRQADNNNCGTCNAKCGAGLTCLTGTCLAQTCTAATQNSGCVGDGGVGRCCASSCADLKVDAINCGSCGRLCAVGESCANSVCGVDTCTPSSLGGACHFDAGTSIVGGTCCGAGCVDTRFDRTNCGGCNRLCPGDAGCVSGICR